MKENLYRSILEASKSREAMRKLEASLTLLPKEEAMVNALSATSRPILGAALTTMLGFGCLAISRVGFISEFGLILSRGIFLSFLSAVMVVPALVLVSDLFLRKLSWRGFRD